MSLVCPGVFLLGVGLVPVGFFFSRTHRACGLVYDNVFLFSGCHPRLTIFVARHCSFLKRLFSVSSFKLSRVVFLVFVFFSFSGSYTQVFLVIGQRPIASFEKANSEA